MHFHFESSTFSLQFTMGKAIMQASLLPQSSSKIGHFILKVYGDEEGNKSYSATAWRTPSIRQSVTVWGPYPQWYVFSGPSTH